MTEEIDPVEDRYSAIHEAGHAVAAVLLDLGLKWVSVGEGRLPDGIEYGGIFQWTSMAEVDLIGKGDAAIPPIVLYLSGPLAERKVNPSPLDPNQNHDHQVCLDFAAMAAGDVIKIGEGRVRVETKRVDQLDLYQKGYDAAAALVDEHWATIEALADLLQGRRVMKGDEVAEFVRSLADRARADA